MTQLVLFRPVEYLDITQNDPYSYQPVENQDPLSIKITTDKVKIYFDVKVQLVHANSADNLYRTVTDKDGEHHKVELPPYCAIDKQDLIERIRSFVHLHADPFLSQQGPTCSRLVKLSREDDRLLPLVYTMFIAIWKTGSGYISPDSPSLGIPPQPENSKTIPGQIAIPRLVIHCVDEAADIVGLEYTEMVQSLFYALKSDLGKENLRVFSACVAAVFCVSEFMTKDFWRRDIEGAPGTKNWDLQEAILQSHCFMLAPVHRQMSGLS